MKTVRGSYIQRIRIELLKWKILGWTILKSFWIVSAGIQWSDFEVLNLLVPRLLTSVIISITSIFTSVSWIDATRFLVSLFLFCRFTYTFFYIMNIYIHHCVLVINILPRGIWKGYRKTCTYWKPFFGQHFLGIGIIGIITKQIWHTRTQMPTMIQPSATVRISNYRYQAGQANPKTVNFPNRAWILIQ